MPASAPTEFVMKGDWEGVRLSTIVERDAIVAPRKTASRATAGAPSFSSPEKINATPARPITAAISFLFWSRSSPKTQANTPAVRGTVA